MSLLGLVGWVIGVCPWRLFDELFPCRPKEPAKGQASRELSVELLLRILLWRGGRLANALGLEYSSAILSRKKSMIKS